MQPVLVPTYKLDARTVELLKSTGVIYSSFDMDKWFIEEQTKNNHLYLSELALYNSGIASKYDKLVMLATNVCDSNPKEFNKEHLRLMLISIKKYFDVTTYTSNLIDVPLCDDYHYNNGYWSDEEIDGKIDGNSDEEINKILIEQLSNKNSEEDEDLQRAINASMDDLKNQQEQLFINAHKDFSDKTTETAIAQPQPTETAITQPQPIEKESKKSSKSTITKSKQKPKKSNKADIYVTKKGQKILIDEDDEENDEGEEDKGEENKNNNDNNDDNNNDEKSYSVVGDDTLTNIFTVTKFIQKRQKYKLTPQMVRFWTLDKKLELSFLDIRKKFVSYITTNKLQAKDDKNLIKVDSRMKDILGLEQDKFFNYTNIDQFIQINIRQRWGLIYQIFCTKSMDIRWLTLEAKLSNQFLEENGKQSLIGL